MYLDTDILLSVIKEEDWLKDYIDISKISKKKTSTLTIIEARIVLEREYSREKAVNALLKIKNTGLEILPIDKKVIEKSQELISRYSKLTQFDAVHAACAIVNDEILLSTDTIFKEIAEVKSINPRLTQI